MSSILKQISIRLSPLLRLISIRGSSHSAGRLWTDGAILLPYLHIPIILNEIKIEEFPIHVKTKTHRAPICFMMFSRRLSLASSKRGELASVGGVATISGVQQVNTMASESTTSQAVTGLFTTIEFWVLINFQKKDIILYILFSSLLCDVGGLLAMAGWRAGTIDSNHTVRALYIHPECIIGCARAGSFTW